MVQGMLFIMMLMVYCNAWVGLQNSYTRLASQDGRQVNSSDSSEQEEQVFKTRFKFSLDKKSRNQREKGVTFHVQFRLHLWSIKHWTLLLLRLHNNRSGNEMKSISSKKREKMHPRQRSIKSTPAFTHESSRQQKILFTCLPACLPTYLPCHSCPLHCIYSSLKHKLNDNPLYSSSLLLQCYYHLDSIYKRKWKCTPFIHSLPLHFLFQFIDRQLQDKTLQDKKMNKKCV